MLRERLRPIGGGSQIEDRRQRRLDQLRGMSDEALRAEMRQHQTARWRPTKILEHTKKHRADFERVVGHPLTPGEVAEWARSVLDSPERVFTGLAEAGQVVFAFTQDFAGPSVTMIVVTRRGVVRTLFPTTLGTWLARNSHLLEVTHRVLGR